MNDLIIKQKYFNCLRLSIAEAFNKDAWDDDELWMNSLTVKATLSTAISWNLNVCTYLHNNLILT